MQLVLTNEMVNLGYMLFETIPTKKENGLKRVKNGGKCIFQFIQTSFLLHVLD